MHSIAALLHSLSNLSARADMLAANLGFQLTFVAPVHIMVISNHIRYLISFFRSSTFKNV